MFSAREYGQMLMCYGEARGNASQALRIYRQRYPNQLHPSDSRIITAAYQRVLDNLPIVPQRRGGGQEVSNRTEETVLDVMSRNPRLGIRTAARQIRAHGVNVSYKTVHKILKKDKQRPYTLHKVQALLPPDKGSRVQFCGWLLGHLNPTTFAANVLWTDESTFTRNGMWNRRNTHIWARENPRETLQTGHQLRWSVNVWAGIHGGKIYGPVFLPPRMNGESYLDLIRGPIAEYLEDVPLALQREMWFQHDGAPPHIVRSVREQLDQDFPGRWMGRYGPRAWPPRSPDLTPLDFFLWGYVKDRVFVTVCDTAEEMMERIRNVFMELNSRGAEDQLLPKIHQEIVRRAELCVEMGGAQFEPFLIRHRT